VSFSWSRPTMESINASAFEALDASLLSSEMTEADS